MDSEPLEQQRKVTIPASLGASIDVLVKAAATLGIVAYVCGFLIVSAYDLNIGFVQTDPFRPRIIAAGIWLFILTAIPILLQRTIRNRSRMAADRPAKSWIRVSSDAQTFFITSVGLSTGLFFIFDTRDLSFGQPSYSPWRLSLLAGSTIASLISVRDVNPVLKNILGAVSWLLSLSYFCLAFYEFFVRKLFEYDGLCVWFVLVWLVIGFALGKEPYQTLPIHWAQVASFAAALLFLFATYFYPRILPSLGGGAPIPVTISFSKDSAYMPNQSVSVHLIDESGSGFYVIGKDEKKATFLPRSSVAMIYFSDSPTSTSLMRPR